MPSIALRAGLTPGPFDLSLQVIWSDGKMTDDPGPGSLQAVRLESYFVKYREHMTSEKITLVPRIRYRFPCRCYVELSANWQHGFCLQYLGSDRICTMVRTGYKF